MATQSSLEVFQDFKLQADRKTQEKLCDLVSEKLPPALWRRDIQKEAKWFSLGVGHEDDVPGIFVRSSDGVIPEASVFLLGSQGEVTIPNIVPTKTGELGFQRYNKIFEEFVKKGIEPAAIELGLSFTITQPLRPITDWLTAEAYQSLRRFSGAANKSTGASHPADRNRWLAFIAKAFEDRSSLDSDKLQRWLVEVERWDPESAFDLARDYEFGRELLEVYASSKHR